VKVRLVLPFSGIEAGLNCSLMVGGLLSTMNV
jgi:hypothetical protein